MSQVNYIGVTLYQKHLTTEDGSCTTTETFGFVNSLLASEFHKR